MRNLKYAPMLVGLLSLSANAQSGVTLYGVADTAIEYVSNVAVRNPTVNATTGAITQQPGGNRASLVSSGGLSGSRWGLRGTEDIGNGLKAIFVLESGFGLDTGTSQQGGRLFGRQAFVGLQSGTYGTLTFGRQYTTMFDALANFVPLSYAPLYEPYLVLLGAAPRQDNTVKYVNNVGPVTMEAHWSFGTGAATVGTVPLANGGAGETPGHFRDNSAFGAGLTYASGPFGISTVYDHWNPADTTGNSGKSQRAAIAGTYSFSTVKLFTGYRWGRTENSVGTELQRDNFYWAGATYKASSAVGLTLAYYYDDIRSMRSNYGGPEINPPNPWQVSFLVDYTLSKRTDIYLTMAYVKNSGMNFDSVYTNFASGYPLEQGKSSQLGAALGVRHRF